jgi:hypothetical protein
LHWTVYTFSLVFVWWAVAEYLSSHFAPFLKPYLEWPFRFLAHLVIVELPAMAWEWAQVQLVPAVIVCALLALGIYCAFRVQPARMTLLAALLFLGWYYGRHWSAKPTLPAGVKTASPATVVPTAPTEPKPAPQPPVISTSAPSVEEVKKVVVVSKTKPKTVETSAPVSSAPPSPATRAWQPTDEDHADLVQEIKSVPDYSGVKAYPVAPDTAMGGAMAGRRLLDLTDKEKYVMRLGSDKPEIVSVTPSSTNLTIIYRNGILGPFVSPSKLDIYWEDIQAIHCDILEVGAPDLSDPDANAKVNHSPQNQIPEKLVSYATGEGLSPVKPAKVTPPVKTEILYQVGLDVKESPKPFVVQCESQADLNHLVSALEFWIRAAQNGKAVPVVGMPYPEQGLWLKDKNEVVALWADSPADKAGLKFGDVLWSIDQDTTEQQHRDQMEKALQSLTTGEHSLYLVRAAEWRSAKEAESTSHTFNPERAILKLTTP